MKQFAVLRDFRVEFVYNQEVPDVVCTCLVITAEDEYRYEITPEDFAEVLAPKGKSENPLILEDYFKHKIVIIDIDKKMNIKFLGMYNEHE
jgi:hypothetical protein